MREDQKGFTLVELMITIAILAIVSVAIFSFMVSGSKSYSSTNTEVNLQHEAQLTLNQLSDLIIDTQKGVTYSNFSGGAETKLLKDPSDTSTVDKKRILLYNTTNAYEVVWDKATAQIRYAEYGVSGNTIGTTPIHEGLMAEYVADFSADLTDLEENRVVHTHMTFEKSGKDYSSNNNITIRNKVVANTEIEYIPPANNSKLGIVLPQNPVILEPSQLFNLPGGVDNIVQVVSGNAYHPSQDVTWEFENAGDHHAGTLLDAGANTLKISNAEIVNSFRVRVTADESDFDGSHADKLLNVIIRRVKNIVITFSGVTSLTDCPAGSVITLTADATGNELRAIDKDIRWSVVQGGSYVTLAPSGVNSATCACTIASGAPDRAQIVIRATSVRSESTTNAYHAPVYVDRALTVSVPDIKGPTTLSYDSENNIFNFTTAVEGGLGDFRTILCYQLAQAPGAPAGTTYRIPYPDRNMKLNPYDHNLNLDYEYRFKIWAEAINKTSGALLYTSKPMTATVPRMELFIRDASNAAHPVDVKTKEFTIYRMEATQNTKQYSDNIEYYSVIQNPENIFGNKSKTWGWNDSSTGGNNWDVQADSTLRLGNIYNRNVDTYTFSPTVLFQNRTYTRPDTYVRLNVKNGNIAIREGGNNIDFFLPYPTHKNFALAGRDFNGVYMYPYTWTARGTNRSYTYYCYFTYFAASNEFNVQIYANNNQSQPRGTYRCKVGEKDWVKIN